MSNLIEKLQPIFVCFLIKLKHWNEGTEPPATVSAILPVTRIENDTQERPIKDIL